MNMEDLVLSRKDDPMDEPWIQPKWKALDLPEFHDDEGVNVIPAEEAALREPTNRSVDYTSEGVSRVATLRQAVNAEEHHNMGVSNLRTALEAAINFLSLPRTGAKAWAADLAYRDEILPHIKVAVEEITQALNIIDIHEQ